MIFRAIGIAATAAAACAAVVYWRLRAYYEPCPCKCGAFPDPCTCGKCTCGP